MVRRSGLMMVTVGTETVVSVGGATDFVPHPAVIVATRTRAVFSGRPRGGAPLAPPRGRPLDKVVTMAVVRLMVFSLLGALIVRALWIIRVERHGARASAPLNDGEKRWQHRQGRH